MLPLFHLAQCRQIVVPSKYLLNESNYVEIKSFYAACQLVNTHVQMSVRPDCKVQKTTWEKRVATCVIDEGLRFLVQRKKLLQINMKKTNPPIEKWSKDTSRQFRGEEIQTVNNQTAVKENFATLECVSLTCIYGPVKRPTTCC